MENLTHIISRGQLIAESHPFDAHLVSRHWRA